ncbi:MAG: hypothetical protein JSS67_02095 [Bacteroidetes bacterium]|nr:hypothetical protein [Bacteroidota bacterium]
MKENKEISALLRLIDDPDEEVYNTVSTRIFDYGKNIIPNLENLWETTISEHVQSRIEMLIHRLQFVDIVEELQAWKTSSTQDVIHGALLVSKIQYPDLAITPLLQEVEKIRRNIWLELNSFLTPLEQAHVISSILYNYYKLNGLEIDYKTPDSFLLNKVIQTKKGNSYSNGILYLGLAILLDLPVSVINIPRQFVLAFYDTRFDDEPSKGQNNPYHFFIDPTTGRPFTHDDIDNYFKRISVPPISSYFKALSPTDALLLWLEELTKCFDTPALQYKKQDLIQLADMLRE